MIIVMTYLLIEGTKTREFNIPNWLEVDNELRGTCPFCSGSLTMSNLHNPDVNYNLRVTLVECSNCRFFIGFRLILEGDDQVRSFNLLTRKERPSKLPLLDPVKEGSIVLCPFCLHSLGGLYLYHDEANADLLSLIVAPCEGVAILFRTFIEDDHLVKMKIYDLKSGRLICYLDW